MRRERIAETVVETHEYVLVRRRTVASAGWCAVCARVAQLVTPAEAAARAATSTREIYRRVEAGLLHGTETPERDFLICLNGLTR